MLGVVVGAIGVIPNPVPTAVTVNLAFCTRVTNVTDRVLGEALNIVMLPIEKPVVFRKLD